MIRGAVLGGNVSKSRSPAIHAAAFRALGVKGRYVAYSVDGDGFAGLVHRLAALGFTYLNVTIPHKKAAAALASSRSTLVRATAAANTLLLSRRPHGVHIRAENTDGGGLLAALSDLGVTSVRGLSVVLVGSGGAAAGAMFSLLRAGARVQVVSRRVEPARAIKARLPPVLRARVTVIRWTPPALRRALEKAAVLISAVPAAAWGGRQARSALEGLERHAAVLEMAYGDTTPLAKAVRPRVMRYQDGIPMLVHQAALAAELAIGRKAPPEPLLRAARRRIR